MNQPRYPRNKDELIKEVDLRLRLTDIRKMYDTKYRLAPKWWEGVILLVLFASALGLLASLVQYARSTGTMIDNWLIFWFGLMVLTIVFSDRLGGLTVAFGVAGAGIAFALQEVIASIAGWAAISFGAFYSTGDRVQLGGIKGDVIDISMLRTTLMEIGEWVQADLYTGRLVKIANSFVFKEPVFNYSGDFPFLWDEISLPIKYGSDWKFARTMLHGLVDEVLTDYAAQVKQSWVAMVRQYRLEDTNVEPMVTLRATDNWIEFTVRYVVDYRKRRWMKDHLFTRILEEIDKSGNRIRLASATFEMVPGSTIDVHFDEKRTKDAPGVGQQ